MYRHGHSDPTFTMRVYQQVLDMGGPATGVLERVLGSTVEEAFAAWSGRGVSGLKPDSAENPQKRAGRASAPSAKKLRKCRAFLRAADGIRTHDLLHGKQTVGEGSRPQVACKQRDSLPARDAPESRDFTPNCGSLRTE
jgi:hypothetical protein